MTEVDWSRLAGRIRGTVVPRSDVNYGDQRDGLIWNGLKPDRFPSAIANVLDDGDIREAVLFARETGLKLVVRGGGHNWQGAQVREGSLVIDLAKLNDVHIDVELQKAIIQPVVTNAQVVKALKEKGFAFPVGDCPTVSASGYLLGGGLGLNTPNWGTACQSVEAVHCVNARGESLVCDATHNTDLYWAARGGAQGFPGVVTRYDLKIHPLPKKVRLSVLIYRLDEAEEFAKWASEFTLDLAPAVYFNTLITATGPAKFIVDVANYLPRFMRDAIKKLAHSENHGGERKAWVIALAACFADTKEDARKWLAPFENRPPGPKPIFHAHCWPTSFRSLNTFTGLLFPEGRLFLVDYHWVNTSLADIMSRVRAEFKKTLYPDSFILVASYQIPPADMLPPGSACFSMSSNNLVGTYGIGDDFDQLPKNKEWLDNLRAILKPIAVGLYVGEADLEVFPGRASQCYSPENWAKLREIKKKHDPDNLFSWFLGDESPSAPQQ